MNDLEYNREVKNLNIDKQNYERELKSEQLKLLNQLKGDIDKDMISVLNGEKIVKLSFKDRILYAIKKFFKTF